VLMTRLDLDLPLGLLAGLDQLACDINHDRSETVRRAVALYWHAQQQRQQGRRLGFFSADGTVETVVSL